ncbi:MAG TPA: GntR family transcriptional regulator [Sphaerochaeta sp.]|nr:GntR family transcriptional regulator [Sphaerochaeta sp.]
MAPFVRTTVSDEIYSALRQEILALRLFPGEELNLQQLGEQMQVSRSPIRDALLRLAGDTLVEIFPQRGTRVSLIDLKAVEEERFLRKSLEQSAVTLLIRQGLPAPILQMQEAIVLQERAMAADDFAAFLGADDRFHEAIFKAVSLDRIWQLIIAQGGNYHRIRLLSFFEKNVTSQIIAEHTKMVEALKKGDLGRMLTLEERHLSKLLQEQQQIVERYPHYFATAATPLLWGDMKKESS